jgi:hypothetical protein
LTSAPSCRRSGLLTAAAQLPRTWQLRLVDMNVEALDDRDIAWADVRWSQGRG